VEDGDQPDFFQSQRAMADAATKQSDDATEQSRRRADLWGKSLLTVGTSVLTALGVGKLADFLPQQGATEQISAVVLLIIALGAVMIIGIRFSRVSTPIIMRLNVDDIDVKGAERDDIAKIYQRFCDLNGVSTVTEYAAIATIIEATFTKLANEGVTTDDLPRMDADGTATYAQRITTDLGADPQILKAGDSHGRDELIRSYVKYTLAYPALAQEKAALVRAEVRWVASTATAAVVRRRAVNATAGRSSVAALACIPIGILGAVVITYFTGNAQATRTQHWSDVKTCLDVAASILDRKLPYALPDCGQPPTVR